MTRSRKLRLGPTRAEVLHNLRGAPDPVPVNEVAAAIGLHPNTTRFHLDALAAAGLVLRTVEHTGQPGRPKVLYAAAHPHHGSYYQDLAQVMVHHFANALNDPSDRAEEAGQAWGSQLRVDFERADPSQEPLDRLLDAMSDLGYAPQLGPEPQPVVTLTPCPYGQLATDHPQVVCQLHLGLVRGLLGPDQPLTAVSIKPWATPSTCLLHLARTTDPSATPVHDVERASDA